MEAIVIRGRNRLRGTVRISGAKNAVLPMLAATVLTAAECVLHQVPDLRDVKVMVDILKGLGAEIKEEVDAEGRRTIRVKASKLVSTQVKEELTREMRSSIFLMGPLLGRSGRVMVSQPGGCAIGPRPIDLHLKGLQALGARIEEKHGYIYAKATSLSGNLIHLDFPSVGATENIMMAAVLSRGTTIIQNAAKEPEIVDLQNFLNSMGACIKGAGSSVIRVEGVDELGAVEHTVIPDRIETGTFMAAAAITGGELRLENVIPEHVEAITAKLREIGVIIHEDRDTIIVQAPERLRAVDFKTLPYPGFPTDMQPQMMACMAVAEGTSIITETIFENRFKHAGELRRMGANITTEGRTAIVRGVPRLTGASVEAPSLREGAALILAGLVAEGPTVMEGVHHLDRGYEALEVKLQKVGADIRRADRS